MSEYKEFRWGHVYKNKYYEKDLKTSYIGTDEAIPTGVHPSDKEEKILIFFMCRRCLKRFHIEVDRLILKLNSNAVASYMKKHCPDCEAFFEMQKKKPEKKDENNLYGRKIEIK